MRVELLRLFGGLKSGSVAGVGGWVGVPGGVGVRLALKLICFLFSSRLLYRVCSRWCKG